VDNMDKTILDNSNVVKKVKLLLLTSLLFVTACAVMSESGELQKVDKAISETVNNESKNTYQLTEGAPRFKATLSDVAWLVGSWKVVEEEGSLAMRVKHFNADFSAWEEKADYVKFPLVKIEKNAIHFAGFSLYRKSDDHLDAYLLIKEKEKTTEHKLTYINELTNS